MKSLVLIEIIILVHHHRLIETTGVQDREDERRKATSHQRDCPGLLKYQTFIFDHGLT